MRDLKTENGLTSRQQTVQQYLETLAGARGSGTMDPIRWGAALARVSRLTETPMDELNRRFRIKAGKGRPAVMAQVEDGGVPKSIAPAKTLTARQRAEGFILGLLFAEPGRWHRIQQELKPSDFTDDTLRRIAELFWRHLQDEGEPVFNEFLAVLSDVELKSVAVKWAEEVSSLEDPERYFNECLLHIIRERECAEQQAIMVELRRSASRELPATTAQSPEPQRDRSSDIETLRKLQEKARHPDLKRVTLKGS